LSTSHRTVFKRFHEIEVATDDLMLAPNLLLADEVKNLQPQGDDRREIEIENLEGETGGVQRSEVGEVYMAAELHRDGGLSDHVVIGDRTREGGDNTSPPVTVTVKDGV
jgi:hypothetical protein